MFIHAYDAHSGHYTGSTLATPDPRDPQGWIIPAFTTLLTPPERERGEWPFFNDGQWVLRPDYRSMMLYRTSDGEPAEVFMPGISLEEAGLTLDPRPCDEHHWVDGAWALNPAAVAMRVRREAMAEFDQRMAVAREKNWGKADAQAAGLLSPLDLGLFKAWAAYGMALVAVVNHPDFPTVADWPAQPDPAEVAEQVAREQEEKRLADEEKAAQEAAAQAAIFAALQQSKHLPE
jgi:hypothetical protein